MNRPVLGDNEVWRLLALFVSILAGLLAAKAARVALRRSASLAQERGRRFVATALRAMEPPMGLAGLTLGLRAGLSFLALSSGVQEGVGTVMAVLLSVAIGYVLYSLVDVADYWLVRSSSADAQGLDAMIVPVIRTSLRVTIVLLTLLQIAQSLTDKPLTSILAGLGVGGLAVALAAQDTVKNFFGSLVLFADKPFQIGDRIVVDGFDGPVEEVGFRSTRIRTLDGHLVTIPNGELANKAIQNIGRRPYIRRILTIGVTYGTSPDKLKRAVAIVKELLDGHEGMSPDFPARVHFTDFAAYSLNIQVIYWYHPPDYWAFMAFTERLLLQVQERFAAEGIEFAFPTQTLHVASMPPSGGET